MPAVWTLVSVAAVTVNATPHTTAVLLVRETTTDCAPVGTLAPKW